MRRGGESRRLSFEAAKGLGGSTHIPLGARGADDRKASVRGPFEHTNDVVDTADVLPGKYDDQTMGGGKRFLAEKGA
jgi:hypothetical protein